jgi:hypothetical protein
MSKNPFQHLLPLMAIAGMTQIADAAPPAKAKEIPPDITFTKDVAPILARSCQKCHRPNNMAPMSLLTYKETRPWASAIREAVVQRNMPPWFIDRNVGIHKEPRVRKQQRG